MDSAYGPHGAALLAYARGDASATLTCLQDGERDDVPAAFWFRETIDAFELLALDLCRGRVLDLGAGTGLHALALQQRGVDVVAIDVEPACVEIMRRRGVREAMAADLYAYDDGPFDTIVALCNGLDKVGRLADLPRFFDRMRRLLTPDGRLLADSFDLRVGAAPDLRTRLAAKTASGRYFGEVDLAFAYKGRQGAPFTALHVDPDTLSRYAGRAGWTCTVLDRRGGHYLACLRP